MHRPEENSDSYNVRAHISHTIRISKKLYLCKSYTDITRIIYFYSHLFCRVLPLQNSTVTSRAKNFKSVQYLLVHGTADGITFCLSQITVFRVRHRCTLLKLQCSLQLSSNFMCTFVMHTACKHTTNPLSAVSVSANPYCCFKYVTFFS